MADERRSARRARLSGVHVTYESAAGDRVEGEVRDLAAGGLFICTAAPLAVGKRIAVDLHVAGEDGPWAALGRVVWRRPAPEGDDKPAGMGVKLIDVDEVVVAAIQRLVETRERTEPGLGSEGAGKAAAAPIVAVAAPPRERTILGVGGIPAPAAPPEQAPPAAEREKSIAIDLVARKDTPAEAPLQPAHAEQPSTSEPSATPAHAPRSEPPDARERTGGGKGWIAMLLLAAALVSAYVLWDAGVLPRRSEAPVAPLPSSATAHTAGAPVATPELPTAAPMPTPTAATPTRTAPSAATHAGSAGSTKAAPSTRTTPAPKTGAPHRAPARKAASVDNPY